MIDDLSTERHGPVDRALRALSIEEKARLLARPDAWTTASPYRTALRSALRDPQPDDAAAARCGIDVQVSAHALRTLYRFAFDRSAVEARAWAVRGALGAAVESGDADTNEVDIVLRRLLLLGLRAGILDDPEPNAPVMFDRGRRSEELRSIAVIGERAIHASTRPGRAPSPLATLRAALPEVALTYSRGTATTDGLAELPVDQLTNPVTGCPGTHVRRLGDGRQELTTQWLPVESDRIRIGVPATGRTSILVGGSPLLDTTDEAGPWSSAELTVTAGVPVELRIEHAPVQEGTEEPLRIGIRPAHVDAGRLIADAVVSARRADVALVVLGRAPTTDEAGGGSAVPGSQHDLVRAIAAANPRTVVVVPRGAPTPWGGDVAAVLVGEVSHERLDEVVRRVASTARRPVRAAG